MQKRQYTPLPTITPSPSSPQQRHGVSNPQLEPQILGRQRTKGKQPNRTTKTSQKLKLFPAEQESAPPAETNETYNQIGQLPKGTARIEAEKFSKQERLLLPRVTAYCTASAYRLDELFKNLQSRKSINGSMPKRFDECIYTPFTFKTPKPPVADLLGLEDPSFSPLLQEHISEVFFFEYGVVVIWGMKEDEEKDLLRELIPFEDEKLGSEDVETEEFHYHYAASYQPRIYNDVITLKNAGNYMVKLTISHAIAQSVKMTLFEGLIEETIEATKHIPQTMAETGKVQMSRTAITKKIGQLFIMRINVNLVSNILDSPEIFWSEPSYEPLYTAIRGYLEISQRVELLNQRVAVISDLLDMLKEHLTSSHGEQLEWIVIVLIAFEIIIGVITICIDAFAYSQKEIP
ncbi:13409_t:CDS:10 [Funneliformis geosporum]|uniref:5127_t:CDS:1 n=1 Tax=Funneliformis geosporum TaxID=1117311 RepID=A0A9W4WMV4_9GLOM|nr:13409_t:CDS:10 [Funneliformis geosporum]CAI2165748.1 5127_t:CDS:10 [Funneliformis geosporum]